MRTRPLAPAALAAVAALSLLVGCGDDDGDDDTGDAGGTTEAAGGGECPETDLPTVEPGRLTVATGEPAFDPWVADDDPTSGEGFEAALVYAVAEQLELPEGCVEWTRAGFDESVAPGEKPYDMNVQQFSITPERDEVVDFSEGYYEVEQALVGRADGPLADAASLADLADARLGAAVGTTSLDYIEEQIEPSSEAAVFDDNAAAKAAFDAGQVDGIVFDLPTAYYITAVEIPDAAIIGVLPRAGEAEELGFLFADGSELVAPVDEALAALEDDGTLARLEEEYLNQGGEVPTLAE